jgi:DNA-binding NarL/FixJ family response regulator
MEPDPGLAPDESIGVLIVDDHEVVRRGLLAFLDSEPDRDDALRGAAP